MKKELIFIFGSAGAFIPMFIYMDYVLDIQLYKHFSFWEISGFTACMIFYSEVMHALKI